MVAQQKTVGKLLSEREQACLRSPRRRSPAAESTLVSAGVSGKELTSCLRQLRVQMFQEIMFNTFLQPCQDAGTVCGRELQRGGGSGARGQCVLGCKRTAERPEEGHQLPDAGHGPLAQERELPLRGDLVRAACVLEEQSRTKP